MQRHAKCLGLRAHAGFKRARSCNHCFDRHTLRAYRSDPGDEVARAFEFQQLARKQRNRGIGRNRKPVAEHGTCVGGGAFGEPGGVDAVRRREHLRGRIAVVLPVGAVALADDQCRIELPQKQRVQRGLEQRLCR